MKRTKECRVKPESWREHYEAWKESGLSQAEYGRRRGLSMPVFRYWVKKFHQPRQVLAAPAMVRLPLQAAARESSLELVVDKKYRLIIRADFDSELLRAVLSSLEGRPCA